MESNGLKNLSGIVRKNQMTRILTIIALLFATPILAACADMHARIGSDDRSSKSDCLETALLIGALLGEADESWKTLEALPEGSLERIKPAGEIQWLTDVAANYTSFYETFCK